MTIAFFARWRAAWQAAAHALRPPAAAPQSGARQLMHLFENSASGLLTCGHDGAVMS